MAPCFCLINAIFIEIVSELRLILSIVCLLLSLSLAAQQKLDTFHIYFPLNVPSLDSDAINDLQQLTANNNVAASDTILILGYADKLGNDQLNIPLSKNRAQNVQKYLVVKGISPAMIRLCLGKGAIPRSDSATKDGFPEDRRVDIVARAGVFHKIVKLVQKGKPFTPPMFQESKRGDLFLLSNVYFYINKHTFKPESISQLDSLYKVLARNPGIRIRIEGHVCCMPPGHDGDDYDVPKSITEEERKIAENLLPRYKLSSNRAWKVQDYLIKKGISAQRLSYTGYGSDRPAYSNDTREGREHNMRVEVRVLSR